VNETETLNKELENVYSLLDKSLKSKSKCEKSKWYYKNRSVKKSSKIDVLESSYETRIEELKNQLTALEFEKMDVEDQLSSFLQNSVATIENGRYTDDVRACYQDLVLMGVGVNNVEKIIKSVLNNIAKLKVDNLPKATFSRIMYIEAIIKLLKHC